MTARFIVETTGPADRPLARALALGLALARAEGAEVAVYAPSLRPLDLLPLRPLLPLAARVELLRWGEADVTGVPVRLVCSWTIGRAMPRAAAVVVGACQAKLATVEDIAGWCAIVAVPRCTGRCDRWRDRWSPAVVRVELDMPDPPG